MQFNGNFAWFNHQLVVPAVMPWPKFNSLVHFVAQIWIILRSTDRQRSTSSCTLPAEEEKRSITRHETYLHGGGGHGGGDLKRDGQATYYQLSVQRWSLRNKVVLIKLLHFAQDLYYTTLISLASQQSFPLKVCVNLPAFVLNLNI